MGHVQIAPINNTIVQLIINKQTINQLQYNQSKKSSCIHVIKYVLTNNNSHK